MVPKLKAIGADVMQFKFDPSRPDLTKLDSLFGLLSSDHQESFEEELTKMETEVRASGVQKVFEKMVIDGEEEDKKTETKEAEKKEEEKKEVVKTPDANTTPGQVVSPAAASTSPAK